MQSHIGEAVRCESCGETVYLYQNRWHPYHDVPGKWFRIAGLYLDMWPNADGYGYTWTVTDSLTGRELARGTRRNQHVAKMTARKAANDIARSKRARTP